MEEAEEFLRPHLVAGDDAPEVLEPGEKPLHLPASTVSAQLAAVLGLRLAPLSVGSNQLYSLLMPQSLVELVGIEGWYNPHRRHAALDYKSPVNYEKKFRAVA
ncbi:hypothetical protein VZL07_10015 [Pseudomyxococcus flavus]